MSDQLEIQKQILDAKENRWLKQKQYLTEFGSVIISFKLNIPHWPKISDEILSVFNLTLNDFEKYLVKNKMSYKILAKDKTVLGPEAFFHINEQPSKIKELTVAFEENFDIGRLLDIDVLNNDGIPLERAVKRSCLLCVDIAINCMRSGKHTSKEIRAVFDKIIVSFSSNKK